MTTRREFLKTVSAATAGLMASGASAEGDDAHSVQRDRLGDLLPLRKLGTTGEHVTMLGVGGFHVGWTTERDAAEVIETAIGGGVRFFDTAHDYGEGASEQRYGKYLVPKYRDDIFLMTKTVARDEKTACEQIETSLRRLKTDRVDLLQVHALGTPEDVDARMENGVFRAVEDAVRTGKARYAGFTGHQDPAAQQRVLERWGECAFFSACQFPVNLVDFAGEQSFTRFVLQSARDKGLAVLAMKTLADGRFFADKTTNGKSLWTSDDPVVPGRVALRDALNFVWSLPVSVLITGAENAAFLREKIEMAKHFTEQTNAERLALMEKVADLAGEGKVEYYKKA